MFVDVEVAVVSALHPGSFEVPATSLGLPAPSSCAVSALWPIFKRPIIVGIYSIYALEQIIAFCVASSFHVDDLRRLLTCLGNVFPCDHRHMSPYVNR